MKKVLLFLAIFLVMPTVFAEITIKTDQNIYNIGNRLGASASVLQNKDFEGLFKLTLSCGNYKLQYFLTTVSLESNFRTALNVPQVFITPSMIGNCTILGDLITNDNVVVDEGESTSLSITDQLTVLPLKSKIASFPHDSIPIAGIVNEAYGNNVLRAVTKITLDSNTYSVDAIDGKFNITLDIQRNIKSGRHIIGISVSDSKGNYGSSSIELEVTAVPSYVTTTLNENKLVPGSKIDITSSIYDQADDLINASLDLELTSPTGSKVFRKIVQSNEKMTYEFNQYADPGSYLLVSAYKNLRSQASINITTVREVKIQYSNESIIVENTGNIPFVDELTFLLKNGITKYSLTKKLNIEPGKIWSFDLSKEVPSGVYDILLPIKHGLASIKDNLNRTLHNIIGQNQENSELLNSSSSQNERLLATEVTIHDNRPIYKKITSSLSSASGAIVGADGLLARKPLLAPAIVIVIILLLLLRYVRKPIMRLFKGKKDEED